MPNFTDESADDIRQLNNSSWPSLRDPGCANGSATSIFIFKIITSFFKISNDGMTSPLSGARRFTSIIRPVTSYCKFTRVIFKKEYTVLIECRTTYDFILKSVYKL